MDMRLCVRTCACVPVTITENTRVVSSTANAERERLAGSRISETRKNMSAERLHRTCNVRDGRHAPKDVGEKSRLVVNKELEQAGEAHAEPCNIESVKTCPVRRFGVHIHQPHGEKRNFLTTRWSAQCTRSHAVTNFFCARLLNAHAPASCSEKVYITRVTSAAQTYRVHARDDRGTRLEPGFVCSFNAHRHPKSWRHHVHVQGAQRSIFCARLLNAPEPASSTEKRNALRS